MRGETDVSRSAHTDTTGTDAAGEVDGYSELFTPESAADPAERSHSTGGVGGRPPAPAGAPTPARYPSAPPRSAPVPMPVPSSPGPGYRPAPAFSGAPRLQAELEVVKPARLRSTNGMRGALNKVGFHLGLSRREQVAIDRRERIRRPLPAMYEIAVLSVKGGVGRTTTTVALGSTFASIRSDRVVAVDANPHFGDLAMRACRDRTGLTLRDLVHAPEIEVFSSVLAYTSTTPADLSVLASPWTSETTLPVTGDEMVKVAETLRRHFNLMLIDCGTGIMDSATAEVLRGCQALLVVTSSTFAAVNGAIAVLNWLHSHGLQHLIAKSVVAIVDQQPQKASIDIGAVEQLFAGAQRPTFRLPYDPHLAEGAAIDLRLLAEPTRLAFEELAAGLADDFPTYREGHS